jgi:hypothetical protein
VLMIATQRNSSWLSHGHNHKSTNFVTCDGHH